MNICIKEMAEKDRAAVLEMMRIFYASDAVSSNGSKEIFVKDFETCIGTPYAEGYVFKDSESYMGYGMIVKSYSTEFGKRVIWIEDVFVLPEYRGRGIGRAFFGMIEQKYPDALFRLEVEKDNEKAISLYKRLGFRLLPYLEMKK